MRKVPFSKYSGAGNDFIFIDNRTQYFKGNENFSLVPFSLAPLLCHRQEGIGADGIILWENSSSHTFKMHIFNADGSIAEMCGNGIRCFTKFLYELGVRQDLYQIENIEGKVYETQIKPDDQVLVKMAPISDLISNKTCFIENHNICFHSINTGVPHIVIFMPEIEKFNVEHLGRTLRYHKDFQPQGTNVNFVTVDSDQVVHIRTYERGVEKETLACGTGCCAAALCVAKEYKYKPPIRVKVRSHSLLKINFQSQENSFFNVTLEGPAKKVFEGSFFIP